MIVLDTNVVSEVVKPSPSRNVIRWLNDQDSEDLFITPFTLGEIGYGIEVLPVGKRRRSLSTATRNVKDFVECGVGLINPFLDF